MGGDQSRIELLYGLLLSLPGSPVMYYGDEIGMGDEYLLEDRDGVRTPMQWEPGPAAGFSDAQPEALHLPPVTDPLYAPSVINVAGQQGDPGSLLQWVRQMLALRCEHPEMGLGTFTVLEHGTDAVLAFVRSAGDASTLVLANFTDAEQSVDIDGVAGGSPGTDLMTNQAVGVDPVLTLAPYEIRWIGLG